MLLKERELLDENEFEGWVDIIDKFRISGWACIKNKNDQKISVDVEIDGLIVATVNASIFRDDLVAAGKGRGTAGFSFVPLPYISASTNIIKVFFSGSRLMLPNGCFELNNNLLDQSKLIEGKELISNSSQSTNPWNNDVPMSYEDTWAGAQIYTRHISQQITGDPEKHWIDYCIEKYINVGNNSSEKSCLILGANEGNIELKLCQSGFLGTIFASDIADRALERAKSKVEALEFNNVRYIVADLNTAVFDDEFDFIIAEGVLHHIENIERCLMMLRDKLKPDGLLMMVEFEGPIRFQLPEAQLRWINAALGVLPKSLRPFKNDSERHLPASLIENSIIHYVHPTVEQMMAFDPSEAISGPNIRRLMPELFELVENTGYGGSILMYISDHFPFKLANSDEFVAQWLDVLIKIEATLNATGILPYENKFYVARWRH